MTEQKPKKKKKRSAFADFVKLAAFTLLLLFAVGQIVSTQADIAEQKVVIEKLEAQIDNAKAEHDEYMRILGSEDDEDYMLTVAVERLGYAYPNERRFYARTVG